MQVDLRVIQNLGAMARCAVTAVTVQGNSGANSINPVHPDVIADSIYTALADTPGIGAVKIGLLGDETTAEILEAPLSMINALDIPIVLDPVMRSTPGSALSTEGTARAIYEKVLPWITLLTPNRSELNEFSILTGSTDQEEAAKVEADTFVAENIRNEQGGEQQAEPLAGRCARCRGDGGVHCGASAGKRSPARRPVT